MSDKSKNFTQYNGYMIDCMGSEVTAMIDSYTASDGDRLLVLTIPDIEGRNEGVVNAEGDCTLTFTPQQAKRLARRLLKLATERLDFGEA